MKLTDEQVTALRKATAVLSGTGHHDEASEINRMLAHPDHSGDGGAVAIVTETHETRGKPNLYTVCANNQLRIGDRLAVTSKAAVPQEGDERARFLDYWCDEIPEYLRAKWRQNVNELLDTPNANEKLQAALEAWQAALASNKAAAVAVDFPYQRTFDAIAAATKIEAGHIAISVRAFAEAYNAKSPAPIASAEEVSPVQLDDFHALNCGVWGSNHSCTCHCAAPHNQIASVSETVPVAEIVLFGGDVKEVAWTQGKMPEVGTKLYTHPAAAQPSRAEVLTDAARDVLAERQRQITEKGHTVDDDAIYNDQGQMSYAAAGLAVLASEAATDIVCGLTSGLTYADECIGKPEPWPHNWKYKPATPRRNLVVAAAFLLAEIERIDYVTEAP